MATGPKIVHKQFNSPLGLYSQQNIKETLNKHMKNLDNGTMGIDFSNPNTDKPGNLANSAVLRMLEEEERNRMGYPSQKKVVWPPVPETNGYHQSQQQSPAHNYNNAQQSPVQQQTQQHYNQPASNQAQQYQPPQYSPQSRQYQAPQQQYQARQQQYQTPQQQYQAPQQQYEAPQQQYQQQQPNQSAYCEGRRQGSTGLSRLIPVGPGVTAAPAPYHPGPVSPVAQQYRPPQNNRWAPVAPVSPQAYGTQPSYTPDYSSQPQYSPQPADSYYQQKPYEPPATTITLRQQQPVHQKPPPVFPSQPAAASYQGGVNMRGDMKWPPQTVKEAVAAENEARRQLAKGPACRPRKVNKDYGSFFAKHAVTNNYPGYRAPPGTQHYEDHSGRSSY